MSGEPHAIPSSGSGLQSAVWGEGVDVVLVHGSISTGAECWEGQRPLSEHGYRLLVPDRRGYAEVDSKVGEDFLTDAADVADLLGGGAHLVGHSYGGVAVLLAAAARPGAVRSLTVLEPPAFELAKNDPAVIRLVDDLREIFARSDLDDRSFLEALLRILDASPDEMPEDMLEHGTSLVGLTRRCRPPWEANIPLDQLSAAPFPKLVLSGGWSPAFETVCDELTRGLGAERAVIPGAGHEIQMMATPVNEALLRLWRRAEPR